MVSKFSIHQNLTQKEEKETDSNIPVSVENLPKNHFTETDLKREWEAFLNGFRTKDIVLFSAINGFKLSKIDESTILVNYPSESAKAEFDKIQGEFLNHFKRKVNNHSIVAEYKMDVALKKEVLTKRKIYEKLIEINPLLKDLDDLMKFDLS